MGVVCFSSSRLRTTALLLGSHQRQVVLPQRRRRREADSGQKVSYYEHLSYQRRKQLGLGSVQLENQACSARCRLPRRRSSLPGLATAQVLTWPDHFDGGASITKTACRCSRWKSEGGVNEMAEIVCLANLQFHHFQAFLLQSGDCAELFSYCNPTQIEAKLKLGLLMSLIIIWGARMPVVRIGRIAGQYAKPRSKASGVYRATLAPTAAAAVVVAAAAAMSARPLAPAAMLTNGIHDGIHPTIPSIGMDMLMPRLRRAVAPTRRARGPAYPLHPAVLTRALNLTRRTRTSIHTRALLALSAQPQVHRRRQAHSR